MDEKWERVGKALQDDAQYVVDDHLPERWIELIKRLNCSIPQSSYWSRALTARSFLANAPLKSAFRANCQEHGRVRDVVNERSPVCVRNGWDTSGANAALLLPFKHRAGVLRRIRLGLSLRHWPMRSRTPN